LFMFAMTFLLLCSVLSYVWVLYTATGNLFQTSIVVLIHMISGGLMLFVCWRSLNRPQ
jgi:hypothetical protein